MWDSRVAASHPLTKEPLLFSHQPETPAKSLRVPAGKMFPLDSAQKFNNFFSSSSLSIDTFSYIAKRKPLILFTLPGNPLSQTVLKVWLCYLPVVWCWEKISSSLNFLTSVIGILMPSLQSCCADMEHKAQATSSLDNICYFPFYQLSAKLLVMGNMSQLFSVLPGLTYSLPESLPASTHSRAKAKPVCYKFLWLISHEVMIIRGWDGIILRLPSDTGMDPFFLSMECHVVSPIAQPDFYMAYQGSQKCKTRSF